MRFALIILLCSTVLLGGVLPAQQLSIDIGQVTTDMDYTDSRGEQNLLFYPESGLSIGVGLRKDFSGRLHGHGGLSMHRYRVQATDLFEVHDFRWDMRFLALELGLDLEVVRTKSFAIFLRAAAGPQLLVGGRQTINTEIRPLRGAEQFDTPYLFLRPGVGFNYCATPELALSVRYQQGYGWAFKKSTDGEKLTLQSGTVTIGLLWSLKDCNYCSRRR